MKIKKNQEPKKTRINYQCSKCIHKECIHVDQARKEKGEHAFTVKDIKGKIHEITQVKLIIGSNNDLIAYEWGYDP